MSEQEKLLPCPFMSKVQKGESCWNWQGAIQSRGYGNYRSKLAHRVSYEMYVGEIPDGLTIDHLCRNRKCVNPAHLQVVTQYENNMRSLSPCSLNRAKKFCSNGHALEGRNIKIRNRKDGVRRECLVCKKEYYRKVVKNGN